MLYCTSRTWFICALLAAVLCGGAGGQPPHTGARICSHDGKLKRNDRDWVLYLLYYYDGVTELGRVPPSVCVLLLPCGTNGGSPCCLPDGWEGNNIMAVLYHQEGEKRRRDSTERVNGHLHRRRLARFRAAALATPLDATRRDPIQYKTVQGHLVVEQE